MVEELKGSRRYIQIDGLRQSFLFHHFFEEGPFRMPRTTLHLTMKKHPLKKQRSFHIGQDDGMESSLDYEGILNRQMRNPVWS